MLIRIQSALRAGISARAERSGPFLVHLDSHSDNPFRNYAVPDDAARPTRVEVDDLIDAFHAANRRPRLEFVTPASEVERALLATGFIVDQRLPLMTLAKPDLVDPPDVDTVTVRLVDSSAELADAAAVQNASYGEAAPTEADIARLRSTVDAGGGVALARFGTVAVGSGLFTPAEDELCEIAAVGVLPQFRRRRIGSAVGWELTRAVLSAGATPYLQTETANEQRLYGNLGYRTVGEMVAMSLPAG